MKSLEWYANDFPIDRPRIPAKNLIISQEQDAQLYKEWRSKLVDGEPKGGTADETLQMKSWGMVGLYKEVDIDLNELLATAKHYESRHMVYQELSREEEIGESSMNEAFKLADDSWQALYSALVLQGQFNMVRDGEIDRVRTIGILYNGHSLSYSEAVNSDMVFSGTNLMSVTAIEELA